MSARMKHESPRFMVHANAKDHHQDANEHDDDAGEPPLQCTRRWKSKKMPMSTRMLAEYHRCAVPANVQNGANGHEVWQKAFQNKRGRGQDKKQNKKKCNGLATSAGAGG